MNLVKADQIIKAPWVVLDSSKDGKEFYSCNICGCINLLNTDSDVFDIIQIGRAFRMVHWNCKTTAED